MTDAPKFYLQWNIVNWITVILMAFVGMMIVGALASGARQIIKAKGGDTDA